MEYHFLGSSSGKFLGVTQSLDVSYLPRNSGNSGWDVYGTYCYVGRSTGKFPTVTGKLKRWSCFSGRNVPNGNSCSFASVFQQM